MKLVKIVLIILLISNLALISTVTNAQATISFNILAQAGALGSDALDSSIWQTSDNSYRIAVSYASDPELSIFKWDGNSLSELATAAAGGITNSAASITTWPSTTIKDDQIIAVSQLTTPWLRILRWNESTQTVTSIVDAAGGIYDVGTARGAELQSWQSKNSNLRIISHGESLGGGDNALLFSFEESTSTLNLSASGPTSYFVGGGHNGSIVPIPEFWRGNTESEIEGEDFFIINGNTETPVTAWIDRPGDKGKLLVLTGEGAGNFLLLAAYFDTGVSNGASIISAESNSIAIGGGTLSNVGELELASQNPFDPQGDNTLARVDFSRIGATQFADTPIDYIFRGEVLEAGEETLTLDNFGFASLDGRFIVRGREDAPESIDIFRFRETNDVVDLARIATIPVNVGDPNSIFVFKESEDSVLISVTCLSCDGFGLFRAAVSTPSEGAINKTEETFFRQLYNVLGVERAQGAGLLMLIIFLAIYLVQGNMAVAGISVTGMFAYFVFVADIGFWTVIPVVFTGIYALYIRYRSAWE